MDKLALYALASLAQKYPTDDRGGTSGANCVPPDIFLNYFLKVNRRPFVEQLIIFAKEPVRQGPGRLPVVSTSFDALILYHVLTSALRRMAHTLLSLPPRPRPLSHPHP